ncbi:hypothetical protein CI102_10611 [Trichoderma harzianum]|nr:hypothetical protein CI102_10611 [Trichoderma harzianum]
MAAVQGGNIAIVKQLLRSGIDIDSADEHGRTALFFAVERNDIPMVRHLIESGSDVDNKDHGDLTPLQRIIQGGNEINISALFTPKIYQRFTDDQSQTLLIWAEDKGHLFAARVLTKLREKHESMLSFAQKTFKIKDRAAAAQTVIPGNDWYALIDPALEPLYFDLMNTLPYKDFVTKLAFSYNGKYIATGDSRGIVRIFGVETVQEVFQVDLGTASFIGDICFSPDGRSLATANNNLIQVFDINTKTVQHTFMHDRNDRDYTAVYALDISYDGRLLASGDSRGTVRIWDMDQGVEIKKITTRNPISSIKILPDSHFVAASCEEGGDVYIWNLKTDALQERISDDRDDVMSTFFSSDGKHMATANDRSIKLWDQDTGECLFSMAVDFGLSVESVFLTPDDRWIAVAHRSGGVQFWDWTTRKCHYLIHEQGIIDCMAVSPLGGCFATVAAATCEDGYAYIWNLKTGDSGAKFYHGERVRSVALSSDGKFLVTGGDSGFKVWDRDTGVYRLYSEAPVSALTALSMTPDDRWIVTASNRGSIRFWDRTTGKSHCIVDAHKQTIYSMAFKPRGGYFVTVSGDETVRIWSYGPRS